MLCPVIENSMTSLSFQTAIQKNETKLSFQTAIQKDEAKLSSLVQFEKEMASYHALTEQSTTFYVLIVLERSQKQSDVIACIVL